MEKLSETWKSWAGNKYLTFCFLPNLLHSFLKIEKKLLVWTLEKDQFVFQKRSLFVQTNSFKFVDFDSVKFCSHFKIMKNIYTWKFAEKPGKIKEISWNFVSPEKWEPWNVFHLYIFWTWLPIFEHLTTFS